MSLETSYFYIKITLSISQSLLFTKIRFAHLYNSEGLICSEGSYMLFMVCPLLTYLLQKKNTYIYMYIWTAPPTPLPGKWTRSPDSWSTLLWVKGHLSITNWKRKISKM